MSARICMISSEVAPLAKTGGLADVCGALTKYLHGAGHDIRVFMPLYSVIDRARFPTRPVPALQDLSLTVGPHRYRYSVVETQLPGSSASALLIDCPALYARASLYTWDPDEHLRFLALTRAALECCQHLAFSPQILHCHDWHTAFGPLFLQTLYGWDQLFKSTRSVLTIHNVGYQGVFSASAVGDLQLGGGGYLLHQDDLRAGFINSLKHGVMYADAITTVSPTYANEIRTSEYGMGLEHALRARGDSVLGILNGVDYDDWNPRTDRYLPRHYDAARLGIKTELKGELLERVGLASDVRVPLAGVVSRLVEQKGIDLLAAALPQILATRELACVVLGSGDASYESALAGLEQRFPKHVVFRRGYDDELAHWIEAGSDLFVMPSRYEPCGLNQMYSLRYGTVPVVRRTGGLADSVERYDPASGRGTGVLFGPPTAPALADALQTTLDLHARPPHWRRMVRNGMAQDFSWARQGAHYVTLYERLIASAGR
jgi:starch synthase